MTPELSQIASSQVAPEVVRKALYERVPWASSALYGRAMNAYEKAAEILSATPLAEPLGEVEFSLLVEEIVRNAEDLRVLVTPDRA